MAQLEIDLHKDKIPDSYKLYTNNNNSEDKEIDLILNLDKKKTLKVYHSRVYQDHIINLVSTTGKNFVLTRSMWFLIRRNTREIDDIFKS